MLEAASLEEDDTVQEMWARLMANAVDPALVTKPEKVYIDILKSLSNREAIFLELLSKIETAGAGLRTSSEFEAFRKHMSDLAETNWRRFSPEDRAISIQNLVRLRCATFRVKPIDIGNLFAHMPSIDARRVPFGKQWAVVDPEKFEHVLKELIERQLASSGMMDFPTGGTSTTRLPGIVRHTNLPEANFMLTPLGKGLLRACRKSANEGS